MDSIIDIYGDEDDSDDQTSKTAGKTAVDARNKGQFVELVIEGVSVAIPHPDHVAYLERRLSMAENEISQLRSDLSRLRQVIREQSDGMRGIRRAMDNKVDRG